MFRSPLTLYRSQICRSLLFLALYTLPCSLQCFAVLGEDASSVQADRAHIHATLSVKAAQKYTIHELHSPAGATVREYASSSGKIFAIAWQASTLPDMKQLLGSHFEEFQQAIQAQAQRGVHGPLIIHQPGLVVELGGHMRSFNGRVYLPDQMPSEVRTEEIR